MATIRIGIKGLTDRGDKKTVYHTVETPEYTVETNRWFGAHQLPDLTVEQQQLAFIDEDENYQKHVVEPAHAAEVYLIFGYVAAPARKKKAAPAGKLTTTPKQVSKLEAVKVASAYVLEGASERIKVDYAAVVAELWENLKHLSVQDIVARVMDTLVIAYRARNEVLEEVFNRTQLALEAEPETLTVAGHES